MWSGIPGRWLARRVRRLPCDFLALVARLGAWCGARRGRDAPFHVERRRGEPLEVVGWPAATVSRRPTTRLDSRSRCNPVRDVQRVLLFHGEHTWESPIAGVRLRYGWNGGLPVEEVRLHRSRYPPDLQSRRADRLAEEFAGSSSAAHARPLACETSPIQGVRELPLNAVGELREKVAADHVSPRYARIRDNAGNDSGVGEWASRNNS